MVLEGPVNNGNPAGSIFTALTSTYYVAFFWVLAAIWLLSRAQTIMRRPKSELIEKLGLTEPVIPEVVIDGLGPDWVSVNWYYSSPSTSRSRRPRVRKHIIQIGGQTLEADRDQRKITINNLQPDTTYKLTVQAVQISHSDSSILSPSSPSIHVSTSAIPLTSGSGGSNGSSATTALGVSKSIYLHTHSSPQDAPPPIEAMLKCDTPELSKGDQQQVQEILSMQHEVREIFNQLSFAEAQFSVKEKTLMQECSELNTQRKYDESQRTQLRIENKNLEDENHLLEVQITKSKVQTTKVSKYNADIERTKARIEQLEKLQRERKTENETVLDKLEAEIKETQAKEASLLQEMKHAVQHAKLADSESERARAVIKSLKNFPANTSVHDKLAILSSPDAAVLGPSAIKELQHELELDDRIEHEWARAQKMLEKQYVDAYLLNSEQKARNQQQADLEPQQDDAASGSLLSVTPSPPEQRRPLLPINSGAISLLHHQQSATRHHAGPSVVGSSGLTSLHMSSPSALHPQPSIASMHSVNSMAPLQSLHSSSLTSVHSLAASSYDPFVAHPGQGPSTSLTPHGSLSAQMGNSGFNYHQQVEALSPTAASDLIPSNLFQESAGSGGEVQKQPGMAAFDGDEGYGNGDVSSTASVASISSATKVKHDDNSSPRSGRNRDASWLPWLTPQAKSSSSRRTTSLFFGTNAEEHQQQQQQPHVDLESSPNISEDREDLSDSEIITEPSSASRSPLKGMSSKFFQKSGNRSGNFVRRLSIFTRKESDQKPEEVPEE